MRTGMAKRGSVLGWLGVALVFSLAESLRLHAEMHLVLESRVLAFDQQVCVVGNDGAQRLHPWPLVLGEIVEHVTMHQFLHAGLYDSDSHPPVIVADMRGDRTQSVMAGDAAPGLHPDLAGRQPDPV